MLDQQPIPQNDANEDGAAANAQNPHQITSTKKRLVKSDAVLEFIANSIQAKMEKFGLLLKEKAHCINKFRDTLTNLINNSDHEIMQNKHTTSDSVRAWISKGKILGVT
jgi:hypothetical protein